LIVVESKDKAMGIFTLLQERRLKKKIASLFPLLASSDPAERKKASDALVGMGSDAARRIIPLTEHPNSEVRASAVFALGRLGSPDSIPAIREKLADENYHVQSLAISALGRLKDKGSAPLIASFLDHGERSVKLAAVGALKSIRNSDVLPSLALAFFSEKDKEIAMFLAGTIAVLFNKDKDTQQAILDVLSLQGELSFEMRSRLVQGLDKAAIDFDWLIAGKIGQLGYRAAAPELVRMLKSEKARMRLLSAWSLGRLADPRTVPRLQPLLRDPDEMVRKAALEALERVKREDRIPPQDKAGDKTADSVTFVEKTTEGINTYEKYRAESMIKAKEFLSSKKVDRPNWYIVVETPDAWSGHWRRDKESLYLSTLCRWQTDQRIGDCKGFISALPNRFSVTLAERGYADNFIAEIRCGSCSFEWIDGLRYRNRTVVQCPECLCFNDVDSGVVTVNARD
jgi:HEAT repeat protein